MLQERYMCLNLISTGKLDDVGFISQFGTGKWKLAKWNLIIARDSNEGSLYIKQGRIGHGEENGATDSKDVWHKRLGHMSEKALQMMEEAQAHLMAFSCVLLESK